MKPTFIDPATGKSFEVIVTPNALLAPLWVKSLPELWIPVRQRKARFSGLV